MLTKQHEQDNPPFSFPTISYGEASKQNKPQKQLFFSTIIPHLVPQEHRPTQNYRSLQTNWNQTKQKLKYIINIQTSSSLWRSF